MASHRILIVDDDFLVRMNIAYFVDHTGTRRRKAMVGRSQRRGVYWHLGFIAKPVANDASHFVMKAAIIFTLDGKTPLDSAEKMPPAACRSGVLPRTTGRSQGQLRVR